MAGKSKIEWCTDTWNPIVGCSVVSTGCTNCYAMKRAERILRMSDGAGRTSHYEGTVKFAKGGDGPVVWTGKVALAGDDTLTAPLRWKRPRRIFVNSMGDLFHESVPDEWIDRVFAVMALAAKHTFQILTKRSKRMREYANDPRTPQRVASQILSFCANSVITGPQALAPLGVRSRESDPSCVRWPLANVWKGVSAERQQEADERVPDLLATPAAVRIVSAEPLLGPIDFGDITIPQDVGTWQIDALHCEEPEEVGDDPMGANTLDWIIAGGESGPGARPMLFAWEHSIQEQCAAAGVPYFRKQWGEWIDADIWLANIARTGATAIGGVRLDAGPLKPLTFEEAARLAESCGLRFQHQSDGTTMLRVGKARAGRLLDGVEHSAMPLSSSRARRGDPEAAPAEVGK